MSDEKVKPKPKDYTSHITLVFNDRCPNCGEPYVVQHFASKTSPRPEADE